MSPKSKARQTSLDDKCRCGHTRLDHEHDSGLSPCVISNCPCEDFGFIPTDTAVEPDICQMCHGEHGPAKFAVRVELFILEDLPLGNCHWLLCEHCLHTPIAFKFVQLNTTPLESRKQCDA